MFYYPTKITTVRILEHQYKNFKMLNLEDAKSVNLQTLINRAVHLYLTSDDFREIIDNATELTVSGSV